MARNFRGLHEHEELDQKQFFRDHRSLLRKALDGAARREGGTFVILFLACATVAVPGSWLVSLVVGVSFYLYRSSQASKERLPFRLPQSAKLIDKSDPIPGTERKKFATADGVWFFGNDMMSRKELWFKLNDLVKHILVFGTTGSGKTEFFLSTSVLNALLTGSGCIYVDPKGTHELGAKIYGLARMVGRDDDFRLLNFSTLGKEGGATPKRLSNTQNPFSFGSAENLEQILVSLIAGGDSGDSNAIFAQNAQALIKGAMYAWCDLRDKGLIELSIDRIRSDLSLKAMDELARRPELSAAAKKSIETSLERLGWNPDKTLDEQQKKGGSDLGRQYQYAASYFGLASQSMADTYGHIFRTNYGEIDLKDIVDRKRVFVVLIPSLQKAPAEIEMLGKIILNAVKIAIGATLGADYVGSVQQVGSGREVKSPMAIIVDEFAAIAEEGFVEVATQARSQKFSAWFGNQDLPGLQRASKEAAGQIIANCMVHFFGKMQDPMETYELLSKMTGEITTIQNSGYAINPASFIGNYHDELKAGREKISRIHLRDMQEQIEGEFHAIFEGRIIRTYSFYHGQTLKKNAQNHLNVLVGVPRPARRRLEARFGRIKVLFDAICAIHAGKDALIKEPEFPEQGPIHNLMSQLSFADVIMNSQIPMGRTEKCVTAVMAWLNKREDLMNSFAAELSQKKKALEKKEGNEEPQSTSESGGQNNNAWLRGPQQNDPEQTNQTEVQATPGVDASEVSEEVEAKPKNSLVPDFLDFDEDTQLEEMEAPEDKPEEERPEKVAAPTIQSEAEMAEDHDQSDNPEIPIQRADEALASRARNAETMIYSEAITDHGLWFMANVLPDDEEDDDGAGDGGQTLRPKNVIDETMESDLERIDRLAGMAEDDAKRHAREIVEHIEKDTTYPSEPHPSGSQEEVDQVTAALNNLLNKVNGLR